jgi:hypothetical protein
LQVYPNTDRNEGAITITISLEKTMSSLASGVEEAQDFFFADTELSADAKSSQLAASDKSAHRLHADIQPASNRGDID